MIQYGDRNVIGLLELIGRTQPVNNYARSLNFGQKRVNNI